MKTIILKKWQKWLLYIVGVVILLFIGVYVLVVINKNKILAAVNANINGKINGSVEIEDIGFTIFNEFPNISLVLDGVQVKDSLYYKYKKVAFSADKIYLHINIYKLLHKQIDVKEISLKNGELNLFKTMAGYYNAKGILKPDADSEEKPTELHIKYVDLTNMHIVYEDSIWSKNYDFTILNSEVSIWYSDTATTIHTKDNIHFTGLTFKADRGSFLSNITASTKLNISINDTTKNIKFLPSDITINKNKISLSGSITRQEVPYIDMQIHTDHILMQDALLLLNTYISDKLEGYYFDKSLPVSLHMNGDMIAGKPLNIDVDFSTNNANFFTPGKDFSNTSFEGNFNNHADSTVLNDDKNNSITIKSFKGNFEGIPLLMNMYITNFADPVLKASIHCSMNLTDANYAVDSSEIFFTGGSIDLDTYFNGKLYGYINKETDSITPSLTGSATIKDGACIFPSNGLVLDHVQSVMTYDEAKLSVQNLSLNVNNNLLIINAEVSDFVHYIFEPNGKLHAEAKVHADKLLLDTFLQSVNKSKTIQGKNNQQKRIARVIRLIISNLEANISLTANTVSYKKFTATAVNGNLTISDNTISCKNLFMYAARGSFQVSGYVKGINKPAPLLSVQSTITNADIGDLFYEFDNFNQSSVTSNNIKGKLSAKASFQATLGKNLSIIPETMRGDLDVTVTNGQLLNMASLQQISKHVFKKRDFSNIQFAELTNTFTLEGKDLNISQMQIVSSALSLYIEGIYSFGDNTNLSIRVPIKNLNKQKDDYILENKDVDEKIGMSIYLKATSEKGKLHISPDLFHKKGKKNN